MKIDIHTMLQIKRAMGAHCDTITVEDNILTLHWWSNKGVNVMTVADFDGHSNYFHPFMKKVVTTAVEFVTLYGEKEVTEDFLFIIKVWGYEGDFDENIRTPIKESDHT